MIGIIRLNISGVATRSGSVFFASSPLCVSLWLQRKCASTPVSVPIVSTLKHVITGWLAPCRFYWAMPSPTTASQSPPVFFASSPLCVSPFRLQRKCASTPVSVPISTTSQHFITGWLAPCRFYWAVPAPTTASHPPLSWLQPDICRLSSYVGMVCNTVA